MYFQYLSKVKLESVAPTMTITIYLSASAPSPLPAGHHEKPIVVSCCEADHELLDCGTYFLVRCSRQAAVEVSNKKRTIDGSQ